jgi:hypothetical protein
MEGVARAPDLGPQWHWGGLSRVSCGADPVRLKRVLLGFVYPL